jgi:phospholipid/cholesterol/gamma-HCH transport system substrate-binding protein
VTLHIDDDFAPLKANSRVGLALRTLVGENYVNLQPGQSGPDLRSGGVLPISQTEDYVEIDKILDTLRGPARERARETVQGLGGALAGEGDDLNATLNGGARLVTKAAPIVGILGNDHAQVARLIDNVGQLTAAIGQRGAAIRRLAQSSRATFAAIAARDDALKATLTELPPTLRQARTTTGVIRDITPGVSPVLDDLARALTGLRPSVTLLRPAALEARALVDELGRASTPLRGTLDRVVAAASPTERALPQVKGVLCQVNPVLRYAHPYTHEIAGVVSGLASGTNYYDATGHASRLLASVGENSAGFLSPDVSSALALARTSGLLGTSYQLGYDPYPAPGAQPISKVGTTASGPADSPTDFTRVYADCGPGTKRG